MLTLLGVAPTTPEFVYDSTGTVNYTAASSTFLLTANPLTFNNVTPPPNVVATPRGLTVSIQVDNSGNLISGTGTSTDLVVNGSVDPDGAGPDPTETGTLLTGEITGFGYTGSGTTTEFDMRFTVTGGLLASFFSGDDIGMTVSSENSETFDGSFAEDFTGGAKGDIGNIPLGATPTLVTTAGETLGGLVGTSMLSDAATLSGGSSISGGSITYTLTAPDNTTTTVGSVPVTGTGTYNSPTVIATQVGTYVWHASYSGDGLNNGAVDDGTNESLTTVKASPTVVTSADETAAGVVGTSILSDAATLSGGFNETGSITFTLTAPDNSTTTVGSVTVSGNGTYSAPTVTATQVGTYVWHASYGGDGLNNGAIDDGDNESLTTIVASPTIVTDASETAGGVVGTSVLSDTATLSGGFNETGSITFTLIAPDSTIAAVGIVPVSGNGVYNSPNVAANQVGTYVWHASYTGDGLNDRAVDDGDNESLTTVKASPAIATTASETAGGLVTVSVLSDSAVLTGGDNATGTITFTLTAPDNSTTTVGSATVSGNGTYNSPNVTANQVGTYVWHASYTGDGLNDRAIDDGDNESLTTVKASTTLVSQAGETAGGLVGTSLLSDSAVLTGGNNVSGTITFTLTAPDNSTTTVGSVTVTGPGTYNSPTVTATQAGTYLWHASYSGDGVNENADDNGTNESLAAVKASPAIATTASESAGGVVGTSLLSDSAVLTGGSNETGTITFTLTAPDTTTTTVGTETVSGNGTYNAPTVTATQLGNYVWHASYSGDGTNNGAVDNGTNESVTTVKPSPTLATIASETAGGVVGLSLLSDAATLSGGYNAAGSITFTLTAPNHTTTIVGSVTVSGNGTYSSPTVTATQVGTYLWNAIYSGDGLNKNALDNGANESLTTIKASPTIATKASETAGGAVGASILSDMATLAGGYNEAGTITFTLTAPNNTTTTVGTVAVSGNGTYSSPTVTATQIGTYVWHASYSANGINNGAVDNGTNESLTTVKASPAITTKASETAGGVVGVSILGDSATLSGGYGETGTITFTLTAPNNTTTTVGSVTVSGNGTYNSPTVTATQVGTYVWHASYSGDGLNTAARDNGANESLTTVNGARPAIATKASETACGVVGSAILSDSATLSSGSNETGTITFTLTAPNNVTTTIGTVTVSGNGTYNSPTVTATQVGTYVWHASYSGDAVNSAARDNGANESLTTVKASPAIATKASETAGGVMGTSILSDSATLTGGYGDSGTITFTLTGPNNVTTTIGTVTVSGNGTYNSPTVTAMQVGTYVWHASYSGNALNNAARDNGANESLTIGKACPTISTTACENTHGMCGTTVLSDSATLAGGCGETGSITFTLTGPNNVTTTIGTVTVSGNGTYNSPTFTATQVGKYVWHATYNGDAHNNAAHDNGVNETLMVSAATGAISGVVYSDATNNGLTCDDKPLAGIQVYLDVKNLGYYVPGDPIVTTGANGVYSFTGLAAGTYHVREIIPAKSWLTGVSWLNDYTITLTAGQNSTGHNFDTANCSSVPAVAVQHH